MRKKDKNIRYNLWKPEPPKNSKEILFDEYYSGTSRYISKKYTDDIPSLQFGASEIEDSVANYHRWLHKSYGHEVIAVKGIEYKNTENPFHDLYQEFDNVAVTVCNNYTFYIVNFELSVTIMLSIGGYEDKFSSYFCFSNTILSSDLDKVRKFFNDFFNHYFQYKQDKRNSNFYLISQSTHGLYTIETECDPKPILDDRYDLFYGKDFPHTKFVDFFESGQNLLLLHGVPGSGKSNYIKNLISYTDKKVIYIPPSMLSVISSPNFTSFMMENKESILLIEDAEEVLSSNRNSATNNLLGITDGFLGDSLKIKVVATFNCNVNDIDQALLRKGRLYYEYKFDKLSKTDAGYLVDYLELDIDVDGDMTLAEIFNTENNKAEDNFEQRRIGFGY